MKCFCIPRCWEKSTTSELEKCVALSVMMTLGKKNMHIMLGDRVSCMIVWLCLDLYVLVRFKRRYARDFCSLGKYVISKALKRSNN